MSRVVVQTTISDEAVHLGATGFAVDGGILFVVGPDRSDYQAVYAIGAWMSAVVEAPVAQQESARLVTERSQVQALPGAPAREDA